MMRRRSLPILVALLGACAVFRGDGATVAKAAGNTLSVGALAEMLASGRGLPLRTDIAERWAWSWVEKSLFAERVAAGDSLLDSAMVVAARWPDVRNILVGNYLDAALLERIDLDSAKLDSVYNAGELRWIEHILVPASEDLSPAERRSRERQATLIRQRLRRGVSWERVRTSASLETRRRSGSLGVIARGITAPEFEAVAFALAPGEISPVTETTFGYHIIRRPTLQVIWDDYRRAIRDTLVNREHGVLRQELAEKWELALAPDAAEIVKRVAASPLRAKQSRDVIGTYKGSRFTAADFVRWLQVLPMQAHEALGSIGDDGIRWLADSLMKNEIEGLETRSRGVTLSRRDLARLKRRVAGDVSEVATALGLDSLRTKRGRERDRLAQTSVMQHLTQFTLERRDPVNVPPFLADQLREQSRWTISYRALDRALERAQELRARGEASSLGGGEGAR